jgi:hypothetical protein
MNPTVELTTPFVDPAFTYRASDTSQMFNFTTSEPLAVTYEIGIAPTWSVRGGIRNNTLNTTLECDIAVSPFITLIGPSHFLLDAEDILFFNFVLNEDNARLNGHSRNRVFQNNLVVSVLPVEVHGPVYVKTNLDPLTV